MLLNALKIPLLCLLLLSFNSTVFADNQQQQIKKKIDQMASSLNTAKSKSEQLRQQVRALEKNLSDISKSHYRTEKKMSKLGERLGKASYEKQQLSDSINQQKEALAQQMQALYTSGEQSHLRLLLKQDDPADIGRTIKYFEYLNRSRLKKIRTIRGSLKKVHKMEKKITLDRIKLKKLNGDLSKQQFNLKSTLKQRESSLRVAKKQVASKSQQLKKLKKQEERLQRVISKLIEKEKGKTDTKKDKTIKQRKSESIASKKEKRNQRPKGKAVKPSTFISNRSFSSLRGRLSWPVQGRMIHTYRSKRNAKQRWKGVVISAPGGRKVRSVARGKVEFSGRLNGYGYLIIIRHDKSYRSLYAYNRSVYKKTGDIVKGGEIIAAVGNSGGQDKNALYFEIRRGTRLQNPSRWCK
ncbi:MAG: peptidoglycan DD-metalloendopeptidase family protein [Cocleimonas sp.]|nr:peptidoglycan DD-metalloendopeptidase family protein [Cocleimonas sp.]